MFLSLFVGIAVHAGEKPNILFIAIDDLRPELGCYGSKIAQSPNLDKLAAEGLLFQNAYCNQAICSPSRASIMTGCRPDTIGIIENRAYFRDLNPDILTLPQHFITNGYDALFSGKIYHNTGSMADLGKSWNTEVDRPKGLKRGGGYAIKENIELVATRRKEAIAKYGAENTSGLTSGLAIEAADVDDNAYSDGYNTTVAIHTLDRLAETGKPFFLGLGMKRPHLPFTAPKKYFDLYNPDDIELAKPASPPKNGATVGLHPSFELRTRAEIPNAGPIDDDLSRRLLHAYYACVSYVDAQIGRMIEALETKGIRDNTIIIVWGDHGWHLGEHGIWGKATNYEIATRVPLLIWTPDMKVRGQQTDALVELVDMYPTLCELAGLKIPEHLEGKSFAPLLDQPELDWKPVAISQFPSPALREWAANPLSQGMRETYFGPLIEDVEAKIKAQFGDKWDRDLFENHLMGYTVRSEKYRMVTWVDYRAKSAPPLFVELYDHSNDPDETINVSKSNPEVVAQLTKELHQSLGW
ncbi:MAG: sulfatase [Verrucomicrobiales bacterium]|nr:sulfatase [Verrucomicrobiales bacterium]